MTDDYVDPRPCAGRNVNICVAEGCYNEGCLLNNTREEYERRRTKIMTDKELLTRCDSLLSLIVSRESHGLSDLTIREISELLRELRPRTNEINQMKLQHGTEVQTERNSKEENYWIIRNFGTGTQIYGCRRDGVLTSDPMLHDRWHEENDTSKERTPVCPLCSNASMPEQFISPSSLLDAHLINNHPDWALTGSTVVGNRWTRVKSQT